MIFNTLEKSMSELENEIIAENLEFFTESLKEEININQELEEINFESLDKIKEVYEPIDSEILDKLWKQTNDCSKYYELEKK